ncbi:MAG TPA: tryptophan 2,3-dioxygenase family protein [Patescibacteria group bacterium]|nr:tryptophan 2,3-dioxygenase family protein [Patescibacteria group bacterium]
MASESKPVYYRDYLQLDTILAAQVPESAKHGDAAHEELLFIIVHQAYELWFKQVIHEIDSVMEMFSNNHVPEAHVAKAFQRVQRVNRILELLIEQFKIMETMTPMEFMEFRDYLNPASGFQSMQFRLLEIKLGLIGHDRLSTEKGILSRLDERDGEAIKRVLKEDSLFTLIERWLENMPFMETNGYAFWEEYRDAVFKMFERDRDAIKHIHPLTPEEIEQKLKQTDMIEQSFKALFDEAQYKKAQEAGECRISQRASLAAIFLSLYQEYPLLNIPFRLLDAIIELDKNLSFWRYKHGMMVTRMIGQRIGTGGSSGADYLLQTAMRNRIFKDLASINSYLIPSREVPPLPDDIAKKLQFVFEV